MRSASAELGGGRVAISTRSLTNTLVQAKKRAYGLGLPVYGPGPWGPGYGLGRRG